jgi:hypothetical protein
MVTGQGELPLKLADTNSPVLLQFTNLEVKTSKTFNYNLNSLRETKINKFLINEKFEIQ